MDRRFNREQYDAEVAVEVFAREMRDEVEPEHVKGQPPGVVNETVQPSEVALWLGTGKHEEERGSAGRLVGDGGDGSGRCCLLPFAFREMQNPLLILPVAAEAVVGASVARQRPGNPMGWVFLGIGALAGLLSLAVGQSRHWRRAYRMSCRGGA